MRILAHLHTLNDDDVIDRSLGALLDQTYPPDEILLVDNGSTDNTLRRSFPSRVSVIRHPANLGTSGAVRSGMQYALENHYDWIWVLDADSAARRDALGKLVELYESLSPELRANVWLLASLPVDCTTHDPCHAIRLTPRGPEALEPAPTTPFYECDATIWTGSLYRLEMVRKVGLPSADYFLDWGEYEYGYQGKLRGYRAFVHQESILDHNIDGQPGPGYRIRRHRLGPLSFKTLGLPPIRHYYVVRNTLYFWLHVYHRGRPLRYLRYSRNTLPDLRIPVKLLLLARWDELWGYLRGLWDGMSKRMYQRY